MTDLSCLVNLNELTGLDLNHTRITNSSMPPLASMTQLEYLGLMDTQISDLSALSTLEELRSLRLNRTQLTDLSPLQELSNLEDLTINGTPVRCIEVALEARPTAGARSA